MLAKGIYIAVLLLSISIYACKPETHWKEVEKYPNGVLKVQEEFYVEDGDSVFIYRKVFNPKGNLQLEGPIKNNLREGLWSSYYPDGTIWSRATFVAGKSQGETLTYYQNGKLRYKGYYTMDEKSGVWEWYDSTGVIQKKVNFDLKIDQ